MKLTSFVSCEMEETTRTLVSIAKRERKQADPASLKAGVSCLPGFLMPVYPLHFSLSFVLFQKVTECKILCVEPLLVVGSGELEPFPILLHVFFLLSLTSGQKAYILSGNKIIKASLCCWLCACGQVTPSRPLFRVPAGDPEVSANKIISRVIWEVAACRALPDV